MELLTEFSGWLTAALTALVMGGLKMILRWKDRSVDAIGAKLQEVDGTIVKSLKALQPIVVAAISAILLVVQNQITGSPAPTAEAVANAPTVTVLAILMRELWVRFVKPRLPAGAT